MNVMKEGDIYRWCWKEGTHNRTDPYWCKSQFAEVRNGKLLDIFWGLGDCISDRASLDPERVDLRLLGNLNDYVSAPYDHQDYERADIMDLRHSNNSSREMIFRRKNAAKSRAVMRQNILDRIIRAQRDMDSAIWSMESGWRELKRFDGEEALHDHPPR